jgi:hypothetical protein
MHVRGTWERLAQSVVIGAMLGTFVAAILLVVGTSALAAGPSSDPAIAGAINLRASDLPGFKAQPSGTGSGNPLNAKAKEACPGITSKGHRAFISSPNFQRSSSLEVQAVQSQVQIESSRRVAATDVAHLSSPNLPACYRRVFEGLTLPTNGGNVKITDVGVTRLSVTVPGADSAYGIRIKMVMSIETTHIPVQMDQVGFGVGRDLLNFFTMSLVEPLPASMENRLESLIVRRALAEPH